MPQGDKYEIQTLQSQGQIILMTQSNTTKISYNSSVCMY